MSKFSQILQRVFAFKPIPTSIALVLVYFLIFTGVIVSDPVRKVAKDTRGLNIDQAVIDLHQIAARPRPFNSHANDIVRAYILNRLQNVTAGISYAHVVEDLNSNATWVEGNFAIIFEGTNILVKIDGSNPDFAERGGVLFSAHYDSVATAFGATDDGIGVVTLMSMVEYLCQNRPQRTAIFNINDGEEDGLHGAHLLLEHPWSRIPDTFLNLEGAGAGGRPLLFRSTSVAPVRSFKNAHVSFPHGNVLSADAFARGVIRSGTDFEVYAQGLGPETMMEGIDFAFYKHRSKYHTKYDSIPSADGGKDTIWAMLDSVRGAGIAMLNIDETHVLEGGNPQPPVYFDFFGMSIVIFTQASMFIFNVVMLIIGPIILVVLHHIAPSSSARPTSPDPSQNKIPITVSRRIYGSIKTLKSSLKTSRLKTEGFWEGLWRWGKFWVLFVFGIVFQVILVVTIMSANRYIVHSQPYIVLISMLTLSLLSIVFFTHIPFRKRGPCYPNQQRLTMSYQYYVFTWILLVIGTALLRNLQIGGTYFLTALNIFAFLSTFVGSVERFLRRKAFAASVSNKYPPSSHAGSSEEHDLSEQQLTLPASSSHDISESEANRKSDPADPIKKPKPHERTPLITRKPPSEHRQEYGSSGWWLLQLLLLIVVPVILISQLLLMFQAALGQTVSDGSSPVIVYVGSAALSLLITLPITPFAFRIHRGLVIVIGLIFIIATIYNWTAFPFSQGAPLKVFFQQSVELEISPDGTSQNVIQALSSLTGVPEYLESRVVSQLPSTWLSNTIQCGPDSVRSGTNTCRWETNLVPSPGGLDSRTPWFNFSTTRLNSSAALISIAGQDTRSCRIYFNNRIIRNYDVFLPAVILGDPQTRSDMQLQTGYEIPSEGLRSIRLWSREWGRNFTIAVRWDDGDTQNGDDGALRGRMACEWSEYASSTIGIPGDSNNRTTIPAYEEILNFLPAWAVSTKLTDGLVEAWANFTMA